MLLGKQPCHCRHAAAAAQSIALAAAAAHRATDSERTERQHVDSVAQPHVKIY